MRARVGVLLATSLHIHCISIHEHNANGSNHKIQRVWINLERGWISLECSRSRRVIQSLITPISFDVKGWIGFTHHYYSLQRHQKYSSTKNWCSRLSVASGGNKLNLGMHYPHLSILTVVFTCLLILNVSLSLSLWCK